MHPDVEKLIKLQETELQTKYYAERIDLLPKQLADLEAKLNGTLQSLNSNKERLTRIASEKKKLEASIQDLEQKNSKYRGQLTDVKTNEQYKALLHEIEFNGDQIRKLEDEILGLMEEEEKRRGEAQLIQQQLQKERAFVEAEKKAAEAEVEQDKSISEKLKAQRQAIIESVTPSSLEIYFQIGSFRKGVALARATEDSCQACHVRIRPHVLTQVISGESIITCDNCSRILYWSPAAPYEASQ